MSAERLREMLSRATPGPWRIDRRFPRGVYGKHRVVATAEKVGKGRADARLIALAPDAIALLADFGELLQAFYDDLPIEVSAGKELLRRLDALCGDER